MRRGAVLLALLPLAACGPGVDPTNYPGPWTKPSLEVWDTLNYLGMGQCDRHNGMKPNRHNREVAPRHAAFLVACSDDGRRWRAQRIYPGEGRVGVPGPLPRGLAPPAT